MATYRCTVYVATTPQELLSTGKHAKLLDTLAVDAEGVDDARAKVKSKLREQGHTVRAVSFTTTPLQMVAYVAPKG